MDEIQLTKNFRLSEFLISQVASRHGIEMTPDLQVIANLTRLCCQVLQPLRDHLKAPIIITSGYRSHKLNQLIGGTDRSQHLVGLAADLSVPGCSVDTLYDLLFTINVPFDQLINEYSSWVHVSVCPANEQPRYQRLVAKHVNGATRYEAAA